MKTYVSWALVGVVSVASGWACTSGDSGKGSPGATGGSAGETSSGGQSTTGGASTGGTSTGGAAGHAGEGGAAGGGSVLPRCKVLVLEDDGSEEQVVAGLEAAGHEVTSGGLYYEWDGATPAAEDFHAVVFLEGWDEGWGLTEEADAALATYAEGGGGLVRTEWAAYYAVDDMNPLTDALMPVTAPDQDWDEVGYDWKVVDADHPLAQGVPSAWNGAGAYSYVEAKEGATVVIGADEDEGADPNVLVSYLAAGDGMVVHINHGLAYTETPAVHTEAVQLIVNAVQFSGNCAGD